MVNIAAEGGDKFVPISSGYLLLEEGEMGSDCCYPADMLLALLQNRGKGGAVSKLMESMAAEEDFEPNQDSSFSEDENIPLSMLVERPPTPGEGRRGRGPNCTGRGAGRVFQSCSEEDCAAFTHSSSKATSPWGGDATFPVNLACQKQALPEWPTVTSR